MYGVKAMVPHAGCSIKGFIKCNIKSLMPSLLQVKSRLKKLIEMIEKFNNSTFTYRWNNQS